MDKAFCKSLFSKISPSIASHKTPKLIRAARLSDSFFNSEKLLGILKYSTGQVF
jgi:hypothetical protein